ncbi:MAG: response regulator [Candidatus Krumholzibacteriia bacterium]
MTSILIVDDDQDIARILRFRLQKKGFDCVLASNGLEALEKLDTHHPDLVLLDVMMPKMDGFATCREIRKRNAWSRIPVIMLTAKGDTTDKVSGIQEGADDYVVKPFEFEELLARIQMILRRTLETMSANPLTGLPGNNVISKKIEAAIAADGGFAACYADLDHFKAYNDEYGFEAGDQIIKRLAEILVSSVQDCAQTSFVGHIGGDDFLFLVDLDSYEKCCTEVIRRFDACIPEFYSEEHARRGYIESISRQGLRVRFPIMSVSIGVVTHASTTLTDPMQVSNRAAEMKKYAKGHPGSVFKVDRRTAGMTGDPAVDGLGAVAGPAAGPTGEEGQGAA